MFKQSNIFQNGFEWYVNSLGVETYRYGNATHAFADILRFLNNENITSSLNIIMPSFIPAKLYRTILAYGYTPRLYEIDENCQFDVNEITELIDSGTKAIFVVHYFGYPAKVKQLRELADAKNIILIEDCAHVIYGREIGGRLGTWGDFSIFSSRKMLNLPEGGYLVLNKRFENFEPSYTKRVNSLYTFSKLLQTRGKYFYLTLTDGNDIFSLSKIPQRGFIDYSRAQKSQVRNISHLTLFYSKIVDIRIQIEKRQQNYTYLYNGLKDFTFLKPLYKDFPNTWTPYSLPLIVENGYRDMLQSEMIKSGISCGAGWPESPFEKRFNKTLELSRNLIEFPVHPFIKINQLKKILDVCRSFESRILERKSSKEVISFPVHTEPGNANSFDGFKDNAFNCSATEENGVRLSPNKIKTEVIKTNVGFDNLRIEWEALCEESDSHIFQTFDWQRLWWKYYGEGKQLYLILFYLQSDYSKSHKLIGIAPFFIEVNCIGGVRILSRLRLIGSGVERSKSKEYVSEYGVSDYLDLIIEQGYEKTVAETLVEHLGRNFLHYDIIQLDEARTDSIIFKFLFPILNNVNWHYKISKREICPRIIVPETLHQYFKQLSPKVRYQLKKIRRDTADHSLFKIKKVETGYELEKYFNEFVRLHQKRWNHIGLSGLFSDDIYRQFLEEVTNAFLQKGFLYFTTVFSNNDCIAVECAFKYKKLYYDYLKAFDDQSPLAKYRPGKALLLLLIEHAIENKLEIVDLLRGSETYKFEFATEWHWIYKVTISNSISGFGFRYSFFLFILFLVHVKRRIVNEFNVIVVQIKNNGISGFIFHYLPKAIKKIKNKLYTPVPENIHSNSHEKKGISLNRKKMEIKEEGSIVSDFTNSVNEIHQE